ncbi:DUF2235 domain-containing protein [Xylanimonas sp. McL0601]|uniref:DUF2235 domain-containing protein n=1 Tax=Xylanimonas sp. McL0601 TaxID=3414739 RepID=UPI003CEF6599
MKRLILCCDGTWNSPVAAQVSNIEKLARSVHVGVVDGVQQVVEYIGGVGSRGYLVDRLLGGAFGFGFTRNVVDGYRFLALNYEPGDEIVVLGYSRGAYTARSVVGMISAVGLLTPQALIDNRLDEAEAAYRDLGPDRAERQARFRSEHSRPGVHVAFLGVFDTVGALGVPGPSRRKNRFHDVGLSPIVDRARQALAIDEHRITFAPCLWQVPDDDPPGRVEQVWFPGTHGDIGGGGTRCGLSDLTLQWMAAELREVGVVLHEDRLAAQLRPGGELVLRTAPPRLYAPLNLVKRLSRQPGFRGDVRVLASGAPGTDGAWAGQVRIAESAWHWWSDQGVGYARVARNVGWWAEIAGGDLTPAVETLLPPTWREQHVLIS